jgi:hypothetical protein
MKRSGRNWFRPIGEQVRVVNTELFWNASNYDVAVRIHSVTTRTNKVMQWNNSVCCSWCWTDTVDGTECDGVGGSCRMEWLSWDVGKKFKPRLRSKCQILLILKFRIDIEKFCTETICPFAGCCEHGNEHSVSILWWNFLIIWVTKGFLLRSLVKFHFTFPQYKQHTTELLSAALFDMLVCNVFFLEKCNHCW